MKTKKLDAKQLRKLTESIMNESLTGEQRDQMAESMGEDVNVLVGGMLETVETLTGRPLSGDERRKIGEAMRKKVWTAVEMAVSIHVGKPAAR